MAVAEDYIQYKIGDYIWKYFSPFLLVLGTFGNTLSIIVLLRKRLRSSTTMFYLLALSFGDIVTLYTGLLRYWIRAVTATDIRNISDAGCKIHTFLVYCSLDFTVWTLVAVTVDRCVSVSFPFRAKTLCSIRRSRFVVVLIIIAAFLKNVHLLWNVKLVHTWEFSCYGATEAAKHFLDYIWPWVDFSTFCLIPFTVMIVCNIKIIYEMVAIRQKLKSHDELLFNRSPKIVKFDQSNDNHISYAGASGASHDTMTSQCVSTQRESSKLSYNHSHSKVINGKKTQTSNRKLSSLTAMLLTVNCVFLITTSPIAAFLIGEEHWFSDRTAEEIAWHNLCWAIVNMLQYLNNAIHFFLYCLTGPRFRREFRSLFRRNHRISVDVTMTEGNGEQLRQP